MQWFKNIYIPIFQEVVEWFMKGIEKGIFS